MKAFETDFRYLTYQDDAGNPRPEPAPQRIYGPLYSVGGLNVCAFLIETTQGPVLIDALYERDSAKITANIRALGFDPRDITTILISHCHSDHAGGSAYLAELSGALVMAHELDADKIEAGTNCNERVYTPVPSVERLEDGQMIQLGDLAVTVRHCPGQSAGSAVYCAAIEGPQGPCRALFAGDATGFKNSVQTLERLGYPGVCADYRATVRKLQALEFDLYCGGHPHQVFNEMRADGNPFVSQEEWLKMTGNRYREMEDFVKEHPEYLSW
ncbi:MBL fold metallo-hydrolase [Planctomycetota bacterium]